MKLILLVLLSYIIFNFINKANHKLFKKIFDTNIIEIVYIGLSIILIYKIRGSSKYILITFIIFIMYEVIKKIVIEIKREKNQIELYQIFSFINNQIRAGLRMEDVVINLHQVINDKNLKSNIKKYCLIYSQQYNIDDFLELVEEEFSVDDFSSIEYAIRNSINVGFSENIMTFQEEMMFNKYIGIIRKKGDRNKLKLFFAAIILSLMLFMQIGYPLFIEFMYSLENIY